LEISRLTIIARARTSAAGMDIILEEDPLPLPPQGNIRIRYRYFAIPIGTNVSMFEFLFP
jgi:hypothetical protein